MNFDLKEHTILLTVAGSRAYGMHTDESDVDLKGVAIPPAKYYTGMLHSFEQADNAESMAVFLDLLNDEERRVVSETKLEGSVYEIRKFIKLAADANPNILDALFCRDEEVRYITPLGKKLRANRDIFLSAKAKYTFSGYAMAQLKRIKSHRKWLLDPPTHMPDRAEFDLLPETSIPKNQLMVAEAAIAAKLDSWEIDFLDMPEADKIYIQEQISSYLVEIECTRDVNWKSAARMLNFDENFMVILDKERKYNAAVTHWKQYNDWLRGRNKARAALEEKYGFDLKHGAHLFRLMTMATEILETGKVNVYRGGIDADKIISIRNGAMTYEDLIDWAEKQDAELTRIYNTRIYAVPSQPPRKEIDELCQELVLRGVLDARLRLNI